MTTKTRIDHEREERNYRFQHWWARHAASMVAKMPTQHQHDLHKTIRAAYMKGAMDERIATGVDQEVVTVGGKI